MKKEKFLAGFIFLVIAIFILSTNLRANEPVVMLNAQLIGDQLTDNEVPVNVWQCAQKESPEDFPLILKETIKISPSGPSMVVAKANCTSHGESGRTSLQIIPGKSYEAKGE